MASQRWGRETVCQKTVVFWDHASVSIRGRRRSIAIRTDARIGCFINVIVVRPERRRLAIAAVRAFVFPGIDDQIVFVEMVIRTREICSTARGAITNLLTFTGHFFGG